MQCCRTACCGPGYCHHQLQVLHWIHIYRRWVSFAPRYTPECAMWSQRLLFIFLYCLQKHCADCRGDSHRLHLHSVLWCAAGTSPGKRTRSCSALMSAVQIHRAVCTWRSQCVCSGILVGCGMQKIAALSNLVAYYCIALPVGAALMFAAHLKILGNGLQHSISLLRCSWIWASDKPVLNTDTSTVSTCFRDGRSAVGVAQSRKRREDVASSQRTLADDRRTQISLKPFDSSNVMLSC